MAMLANTWCSRSEATSKTIFPAMALPSVIPLYATHADKTARGTTPGPHNRNIFIDLQLKHNGHEAQGDMRRLTKAGGAAAENQATQAVNLPTLLFMVKVGWQ